MKIRVQNERNQLCSHFSLSTKSNDGMANDSSYVTIIIIIIIIIINNI